MIEIVGDIFTELKRDSRSPYSMVLVPTNGCVTKDGRAIMGAGFAKAVRDRYPSVQEVLGQYLQHNRKRQKQEPNEPWNVPYLLGVTFEHTYIFSFPTKPSTLIYEDSNVLPQYARHLRRGCRVEGWKGKADLHLIERSAVFISRLVDDATDILRTILLPQVGCGYGELSWETDVRPLLAKYFDQRYTVVKYQPQ